MNKFKRGDRIVFVKDDDYDGIEMPKGTIATYDDDAPTGGLVRWVKLDTGERVAAYPDVIAPYGEDHGTGDGSASDICAEPGCNCDPERRFPAPLDPKAAVRAGDTVTLERHCGLRLEAEVNSQIDITVAGKRIPLDDFYRDGWTLTAHTPAPEPEPEWKPGTVLLGNLPGPYPDDQFWVVDDGETNPYVVDDTGVKHYPADLLNVREAVVIDPATVDVEALTTVGDEAYLTDQSEFRRDGIQAAILAALAHLGIEVPR